MSLYSDMLEMQNWKAVKTIFLVGGTEFWLVRVTSVTRDSITVETTSGEIIIPKTAIVYAVLDRQEPL